MDEAREAREVILALRAYSGRIAEIMDQIGDRRSVLLDEKAELQAKLAVLKGDIRLAAKQKKIVDDRLPQTETEQCYFEPALQAASANFNVSHKSHPVDANWNASLASIKLDIDYLLNQLERQFPDI